MRDEDVNFKVSGRKDDKIDYVLLEYKVLLTRMKDRGSHLKLCPIKIQIQYLIFNMTIVFLCETFDYEVLLVGMNCKDLNGRK